MLYKSDGITVDDDDSTIPLPPHIAERLRKKSDSPIDAETYEAQHGQSEPRFMVGGVAIAAGSTKDFVFDVNGLSLHSDYPIAPFQPLSSTWKGLTWQSFVSDLNELTIRVSNVTNHSITPAMQGFLVPGNHDYGSPGTEPPKTARTVKAVMNHAERSRGTRSMNPIEEAVFREYPHFKAAVEAGTMRIVGDGTKLRIELVSLAHTVTKLANGDYLAVDNRTGSHDRKFEKQQIHYDGLSEYLNGLPEIQSVLTKHWTELPQEKLTREELKSAGL